MVDVKKVDVKKFDWLTVIMTVVPLILGGSVVTSLITLVLADMNKPDVKLDILPQSDSRSLSVFVHNIGRSPATNLKISVNAPENISHYNAFTTDNINLTKVSPSRIFLNASKLVHGDGSQIVLDVRITGESSVDYSNKYTVFAIYDQGSSKGTLPRSELTIIYDFIVSGIFHHPIYLMIFMIIVTPLSIYLLKRVLRKRRNQHFLHYMKGKLRDSYQDFSYRPEHTDALKEYNQFLDDQFQLLDEVQSRGIISEETYGQVKKLITQYKEKKL